MNGFMALIIIVFFLNTNAIAFVHFHVYVKNETGKSLVINKKIHVRPHKQHILQTFFVSDNYFFQEQRHLKGSVKIKKKASPLCQFDFYTYTILDSGKKEFKTFLLVQKIGNKYVCTPIAGEVFPQGNTLKPKGMRLTISEAFKRHETWKRQIENSGQGPVFMIAPNIGVQQPYSALIKRSH
tara:strand:+ start:391 stop:936 length:546 start_codon:yes stop_codon:yes gene_type:complete